MSSDIQDEGNRYEEDVEASKPEEKEKRYDDCCPHQLP
jgi:hypothetical protein